MGQLLIIPGMTGTQFFVTLKVKKWYAVILEVSVQKLGLAGNQIIDILNVKSDPLLIGSLRSKQGYFPAYHMNKEKWVSIALDGSVPDDEIKNLLDMSYKLTRK